MQRAEPARQPSHHSARRAYGPADREGGPRLQCPHPPAQCPAVERKDSAARRRTLSKHNTSSTQQLLGSTQQQPSSRSDHALLCLADAARALTLRCVAQRPSHAPHKSTHFYIRLVKTTGTDGEHTMATPQPEQPLIHFRRSNIDAFHRCVVRAQLNERGSLYCVSGTDTDGKPMNATTQPNNEQHQQEGA